MANTLLRINLALVFSLLLISLLSVEPRDMIPCALLLGLSIFSLSLVIALLWKDPRQHLAKTLHLSAVIIFSLLPTLVIAIFLPYLILPDRFLAPLVLQYAYLFPLLILFFGSLSFFHAALNNTPFNIHSTLRYAISISIALSLLLSLLLTGYTVLLSTQNAQRYDTLLHDVVTQHITQSQEIATPNLNDFNEIKSYIDSVKSSEAAMPVFMDIRSYEKKFLEETREQQERFHSRDVRKGFCILENCFDLIADRNYHSIAVVITTALIQRTLKDARTFLLAKNSTLDLAMLRSQVESIPPDSPDPFVEISYHNLLLLRPENTLLSEPLFSTHSPLFISLSSVVEHSTPYQELVRLIVTTRLYTTQQGSQSDLLLYLYKRKDVEEPPESKMIRYQLLTQLNTVS